MLVMATAFYMLVNPNSVRVKDQFVQYLNRKNHRQALQAYIRLTYMTFFLVMLL